MKLSYFRGAPEHTNFGDELNAWMWPRLLPDFFDGDDSTVFLGIGSIIGKRSAEGIPYRPDQKKVVFGSGFVPTYHERPDVHDGTWDIFFVRGPRTVQQLNIAPDMSVGDSAILLRTLVDFKKKRPQEDVGYMPHWRSLFRGDWEAVCRKAGVRFLDPRRPVEELLEDILSCRVVVAEAMHGAIVADALRVPWVPVMPIAEEDREKWFDWIEALSSTLSRHRLPPSSLVEARELCKNNPVSFFLVRALNKLPVVKPLLNALLVSLAARKLRRVATAMPSLSSEEAIQTATQKMLQKLGELREKYSKNN